MKKFDLDIFMVSVRQEAGEGPVFSLKDACQLLRLKNEAFLRAAYSLFFNREPDATGMAAYLPRASNLFSRIELLAVLYLAAERKYLPPWQRWLLEKGTWLVKFKWLR